jgi:hypothetical protein
MYCEGVVIVRLEWLMTVSTGLQQVEEKKTQNWSKRVCWGSSVLRAAPRYRSWNEWKLCLFHLPRKREDQPYTYSTDSLTLRLTCVSDTFHEPKRGPITTRNSVAARRWARRWSPRGGAWVAYCRKTWCR